MAGNRDGPVLHVDRGERRIRYRTRWDTVVREALVALVRLVLVKSRTALLGWSGCRYRQVVEPVGFHFDVYMVPGWGV